MTTVWLDAASLFAAQEREKLANFKSENILQTWSVHLLFDSEPASIELKGFSQHNSFFFPFPLLSSSSSIHPFRSYQLYHFVSRGHF